MILNDYKNEFKQLSQVIKEADGVAGSLIPIMQKAQELFGYLPFEVQQFIGKEMNIPLPDIYGVATFYSQFKLKAQGKHSIGVCQGTACYVKGSKAVQDEIEKDLSIKAGETSKDLKFTLNETRCVGACGLAPVIMIDDDAHGRLVPADIKAILEKYK